MNIRQLEAFHNTIETGSVTLAAERIFPIPAASSFSFAPADG
jgi:DNA-binding transcriptional LysR family regulator